MDSSTAPVDPPLMKSSDQMKIVKIVTRTVMVPVQPVIASATVKLDTVWYLLADIYTDDGAIGSAYIWSYNPRISAALTNLVDQLSPLVLGQDPRATARIWGSMWRGIVQWGRSGLTIMAMSVVDAALWDLVGKISGQSVGQLLGLRSDTVMTYASGGLWITDDLDSLRREARQFVTDGFKTMKMRAGRPRAEDDIAAVRAVREAIGPDIGLMADLGSTLSREHATRLCFALEEFNLVWFEDPIADENTIDHAELARSIRTPICFGEKIYAPRGFQTLIEGRAADHLMADLQRAGGVTGWQRIAALADAAGLPLSSHILPEINVQLVASAPTGAYLEYMQWADELFEEKIVLRNGEAVVPMRPGFGFKWNEDRVRHALQSQSEFV